MGRCEHCRKDGVFPLAGCGIKIQMQSIREPQRLRRQEQCCSAFVACCKRCGSSPPGAGFICGGRQAKTRKITLLTGRRSSRSGKSVYYQIIAHESMKGRRLTKFFVPVVGMSLNVAVQVIGPLRVFVGRNLNPR